MNRIAFHPVVIERHYVVSEYTAWDAMAWLPERGETWDGMTITEKHAELCKRSWLDWLLSREPKFRVTVMLEPMQSE